MNGPQDLGGAHGFGTIAPDVDEPLFHADWERRALALTVAMGATGAWNLDASRHARERTPPAKYLSSSYYEIWLAGLDRLLLERGLVSRSELDAGRALEPAKPLPRRPTAETIPSVLETGVPTEREASAPARFAVGDRVRAKTMNPIGHTRLPRYARGRTGTIARIHGAHVFPDDHAHGRGENPQWLYSVAFEAREIWGAEGRAGDFVHIDLFEPYLEPA